MKPSIRVEFRHPPTPNRGWVTRRERDAERCVWGSALYALTLCGTIPTMMFNEIRILTGSVPDASLVVVMVEFGSQWTDEQIEKVILLLQRNEKVSFIDLTAAKPCGTMPI